MERVWHSDFSPARFLSKVNLTELLRQPLEGLRAETFDASKICAVCERYHSNGLRLNDGLLVCSLCIREIQTITYPERYEASWRSFLQQSEAHKLARAELTSNAPAETDTFGIYLAAFLSLYLLLYGMIWGVVTASLFALASFLKRKSAAQKVEFKERVDLWDRRYPAPVAPVPLHFHDPEAVLTEKDRRILYAFEHWPGYPPFWDVLRRFVLQRDENRCQVTGCPSRLSLHVHHKLATSQGGSHSPGNLITLCEFHHAIEPEPGHQRIWSSIENQFFSFVREHERSNRSNEGMHFVQPHLRRKELVTRSDIDALNARYAYTCPRCGRGGLEFELNLQECLVKVYCPGCGRSGSVHRALAEEVGPKLAEIFTVSKNYGKWKPNWDSLDARRAGTRRRANRGG